MHASFRDAPLLHFFSHGAVTFKDSGRIRWEDLTEMFVQHCQRHGLPTDALLEAEAAARPKKDGEAAAATSRKLSRQRCADALSAQGLLLVTRLQRRPDEVITISVRRM